MPHNPLRFLTVIDCRIKYLNNFNRLEKWTIIGLMFFLCLISACCTDKPKVDPRNFLEFKIIGQIFNQEINDFIVSNDTFESTYEWKYFDTNEALRRTLKHDYLVVNIYNYSENACLCGVGFNGFLAGTGLVLTDSLYFTPKPGVEPISLNGKTNVDLKEDTTASIPAKSNRLFLVMQPFGIKATSQNVLIGYTHTCRFVDNNYLPIDSLNVKYLIKYFVSEYHEQINIR